MIAGVRPVRLLDHHAHRVGIERDVVVAEEQERRAFHRLQRDVGGRPEAAVLREPAHVRGRQRGRDPRGRVDLGGVVEHEHRQRRVVLRGERRDRALEQRPRRPR